MRFPNAQAGVTKLFIAQIFLILAVVCSVLSVIGLLTINPFLISGSIAMVVLLIAAYILELVALGQARKDDENFRNAFFLALAALVLSVVAGCVRNHATLYSVLDMIAQVVNILVMAVTILGIQSVAQKLHDEKLVNAANRQIWLILIPYLLGVILNFVVSIIRQGKVVAVVAIVLGVIAAVIEIVAFILYLGLLNRARHSFKA